METLFVKYSDVERNKKYKIKTEIVEENCKKKVLKQALNEESQKHINNIFYNYKKLKNLRYKLNLAKCYMKEKKVYFEYIEGTRLDEVVIKTFFKNGKELFIEKLKEIKIIIDKSWNEKIVNLDLTLDNMIINRKGIITVIDYEWIYEGKIERDFIFYRLLEVFYTKYSMYFQNKFSFENLLKEFDLTEEKILELKKMNVEFYKRKLSKKEKFHKKKHEYLKKEEYLQIYYNYGNGFIEEDSVIYEFNYINDIELKIPIKEGMKSLRIDPKNKELNLKVKKSILKRIDGIEEEINFESNAIYNNEKCYIFTTEDPQIYFKNLSEGVLNLIFKEIKIEEVFKIKK